MPQDDPPNPAEQVQAVAALAGRTMRLGAAAKEVIDPDLPSNKKRIEDIDKQSHAVETHITELRTTVAQAERGEIKLSPVKFPAAVHTAKQAAVKLWNKSLKAIVQGFGINKKIPYAKICTYPGCDRVRPYGLYCPSHNKRAQQGELDKPIRGHNATGKPPLAPCTVKGCDKFVITSEGGARGLCSTHYRYQHRQKQLRA